MAQDLFRSFRAVARRGRWYRTPIVTSNLQMPLSHGQRAFWRNGALSRPTAGVTFANRVEFCDWLILDGPLHSNANLDLLFLYGRSLFFRVHTYCPQYGSPRKICRGGLKIRPKNNSRNGPAFGTYPWVAQSKSPWTVGGVTQTADPLLFRTLL